MGEKTAVGEKHAFMARQDDIKLPVTVVNGAESGPTLLLAAGTHGDEFPSIFALQRLAQELDAQTVKGTVIFLHLANLDGFHGRRLALNPKDEKNLNREFPGSPTGTATEQLANLLTREFISKIDYFVDMHSGSSNQKLLNHVYSPFVGDEKLDALTFEFAKATGMQHIVMYGDRPRDPANSVSFPNTAMTRGIPGLTTEVGHLAERDEKSIEFAFDIAKNTMIFLDMLPGEHAVHPNPVIYENVKYLNSAHDGFFTPLTIIGQKVKAGARLGTISDYFGKVQQTITAPTDGTILMINETPPIQSGESPVAIGIVR
ncbi:succinylglutamate desuccinylase [Salinimonas sp. HHU 13199]|uniref:Succinylglutamate desuccinylase n=2 Tax=Salinimonas profundi TaxID=2729140 RepID=A0ABR8LL42_9ALTE|nr:succinylglutamate desuccinylase [Salinimonas profundi]